MASIIYRKIILPIEKDEMASEFLIPRSKGKNE